MSNKRAAVVTDRLGNNALVKCFRCQEDYIVGSPPIYKKPRVCPHCGGTQAMKEKDSVVYIEDMARPLDELIGKPLTEYDEV